MAKKHFSVIICTVLLAALCIFPCAAAEPTVLNADSTVFTFVLEGDFTDDNKQNGSSDILENTPPENTPDIPKGGDSTYSIFLIALLTAALSFGIMIFTAIKISSERKSKRTE